MSPTPLPANTSGCSRASSTDGGSSGQPGLTAAYPASSKKAAQRSQLESSSQSPCTKTTGCLPEELARSTSSSSEAVGGGMVGSLMLRSLKGTCEGQAGLSAVGDGTPSRLAPS